MAKPLVDAQYLLQKFPGKGGWTYAVIPEIKQDRKTSFGWVKVKGSIDGYPLKQHKLMPMGDHRLFLPVKAAIRKKIKKEAGDYVHVILDLDKSFLEIPEEILLCFEDEPAHVLESFKSLTEGEQKTYLDWIYAAKKMETRANRIMKMMKRVAQNKPLHEKKGE